MAEHAASEEQEDVQGRLKDPGCPSVLETMEFWGRGKISSNLYLATGKLWKLC